MKKIIALLLTASLCFVLCACGGTDTSGNESFVTGVSSAEQTNAQEATKNGASSVVALGQEIDMPFAKMCFTSNALTYSVGGSGFSSTAQDGMRMFSITGTIENTSGSSLPVGTVHAEMTFNNEYTYTAQATILDSKSYPVSVAPLTSAEYWIYAEIPEKLLDTLSTCEVHLSLNKNFESYPKEIDDADYNYTISLNEDICVSILESATVATEFFAECPILPTPANYSPVWQTSSSSNSFNGKVTSIQYSYSVSPGRNDDLKGIYSTYISNLNNIGFTIQTDADNRSTIYSDGNKLATISVDSNRISFDVVPGNEGLTNAPSGATNKDTTISNDENVVHIGDTIETDYFSMTLESQDSGTEIRSGTSQYGGYTYYTSENGDPYFFVYGTLKNLGGNPVDIRNIYVQFCFDGKYNYKGSVDGVADNSNRFIVDVSPLASVNYYMYTSVPQELIDSYTTCSVRIGFTENFDYKVVDVNDLPKFENCDDVFCLEVVKE